MDFAGFAAVANDELEHALPHVAAVAASAPVNDGMLDAARKRAGMILTETGDRATVTEATFAEIKKHELYNLKINRDGAFVGSTTVRRSSLF